jgi:hypothetical protein
MFRNFPATVVAVAAIAIAGAPLSKAFAVELQPGQWQEVETGIENGKPVPAETTKSCMTAEEAKDPLKGLSPEKDMKGQCKTYDIKQSPSGLSMRLRCGDAKQFAMDISASFTFATPRSYVGSVKSSVTVMGKTTVSDKKIEGKWLSAHCKKK